MVSLTLIFQVTATHRLKPRWSFYNLRAFWALRRGADTFKKRLCKLLILLMPNVGMIASCG
jgi:hypothetical protein